MNRFIKEIRQQPEALENTLKYYIEGEGDNKLKSLLSLWKTGSYRQLLFTGMGSSFFAPHMILGLLNRNGIISNNINAGELLHYNFPLIGQEILLSCVSQSGESFEIVNIIEKLEEGRPFVGITNDNRSTLAKRAAVSFLTKAGNEEMTSTKTFVSTLLALNILAVNLINKLDTPHIDLLKSVIENVDTIIRSKEEWLQPAMEFAGNPSFVQVIGRGPAISSVKQASLMIMEAARKPSSGSLGGEFRHGPMEMVKENFTAIVMVPEGITFQQGINLSKDIARFGGKVLVITNSDLQLNANNILTIQVPCDNEYLFPIPAIVPLQYIVNEWAGDAGKEPGSFVRGAKVTKRE